MSFTRLSVDGMGADGARLLARIQQHEDYFNSPATGTITCVTKANLVDGETLTIGSGILAATVYEFDVNGTGVTAGRVQVNVSTDTTAAEVATRLKTAIEANNPMFTVAINSAVLTLTSKIPGSFANVTITETVANAGFLVTGMAGGVTL